MKILVATLITFLTQISVADLTGIWRAEGQHPRYGSYSGELEIRPSAQVGQFQIIRVINYSTISFEGLRIQEVLTGIGVLQGQNLVIQYNLKRANYLIQSFGVKKNREDFHQMSTLRQMISWSTGQSYLSDDLGRSFNETLNSKRSLGPQPLWVDQRQQWASQGDKIPSALKLLWKLKIEPVIKWYRNQPEVKAYEHRPEFQNKSQFFVFDPTDFDFYQKNKNIIRVVNSVIDDVTLTEAISRRNAYSPSLEEKAQHFDSQMKTRHINELGIFSKALVDAQGNQIGFGGDGDGALWTGIYVASQAMRYLATKDPVALENVKKSTRGLFLLIDVTGDPKEFARYVMMFDPNEKGEVWRRGTGVHTDKMWIYGGNNDMFKGLIVGYTWAALVVPQSDVAFWNELRQFSTRVLGLNLLEEKKHNRPLAYGVAALVTKDSGIVNQFIASTKDTTQNLTDLLDADSGFYVGGIADWSGINLGMAGDTAAIAMTEELLKSPSLSGSQRGDLGTYLSKRRQVLMDQWDTYKSTRRDYLTLAAYAFANRAGVSAPDAEMWRHNINTALWSLREIPMYRSRYDVYYDYSLKPDWVLSAWPRLPWKSVKDKQPIEYHMQGVYQYPLFEGFGYGSNYIWKDGTFLFKGASQSNVIEPGTDYLFSYWMARWSGLAQPDFSGATVPLPLRPQRLNLPPEDPAPVPPPPPPVEPTPPPVAPPPPASPIAIEVGRSHAPKFVPGEKDYGVASSDKVIQVVVSGLSREAVKITEAYVEFADNGERRRVRELEYEIREGESRVQPIESRPLRKVIIKAVSSKASGGRGEYKVDVVTIK